MDRLWFHQCVQGFLSLATIRSRDIRQFTDEHPYQSNIRLLEARQDSLGRDGSTVLHGAFQVPDRRSLFQQIHAASSPDSTYVHLSVSREDPDPQTVGQSPSVPEIAGEGNGMTGPRLLPVYIRPEHEIATASEEAEEEWEQLEERLREEYSGDEEESDLPEMSAAQDPPPPPTPPSSGSIFDRFDRRIDGRAFGVAQSNETSSHQPFIEWVTSLEDADGQDKDSSKSKKSSRKNKKKKRKLKKEAKRLAKLSVQKKQVVATETLAELLTRQGHHKDAIDMYERLCLIYPEKKAIFAARIESIKSSHP